MAFRGKVALVTGGGSGMGQICAWRLADAGADVALIDVNETGMETTRQGRSNIYPYACDVTDFARVKEVVADVEQRYGPIDRVTHAAAIMPASPVLEDDLDRMKRLMRINYDGTLHMVMSTLPKMVERNFGDFICFGSVAAYALTPHLGAYCASKAAVNALIEVLIWENKDSDVRIHLTCPPMVNTPLLDQAKQTSNPRSIQEGLEKNIAADPNTVVDAIERALDKGKKVSYPGAMAKGLYGMRRLAPGLLWNIILRSENSAPEVV
jgi:NAD(P)-dependent dehydrogenase (short-subunit alcohol dehydrogenase family)